MNETNPCGQVCETCPSLAACPTHAPVPARLDLDEARARFEREAVRGVCDTGRYRMAYYTWGEGPPLLFVHGLGDTAESFVQTVAGLSGHFRCIAYNLPTGRGDGARMRRLSHAGLVADLWALLDHLKVERSYVFASSFGSTVALAAMREGPGRLPRAVLQGGFAHRPLRRAENLLARVTCWLPGPMRRLPVRDRILEAVHFPFFKDLPAKVWMAFVQGTGQTPVKAFSRYVLLLRRLDLRPLLTEVRQPVLLVVGERDLVIGRAHEDVLMQGLPNAGKVTLEGCGHLPTYTHPEMLAAVVRRFLTPPGE